jgi:hypothetical protein
MSLPKILISRFTSTHFFMIYINNPTTYNPAVVINSTVYVPLYVCLLTVTDPEVTSPTRVRTSYGPIWSGVSSVYLSTNHFMNNVVINCISFQLTPKLGIQYFTQRRWSRLWNHMVSHTPTKMLPI